LEFWEQVISEKFILSAFRMIPEFELVGFYDADVQNAKIVSEEFGYKILRKY
jgi:hypothetical protein